MEKDQTHWSNQGPLHFETDNPTFTKDLTEGLTPIEQANGMRVFEDAPKVRNCTDCKSKGERLEVVLNGCSATVDYCKKGHTIYKARPCEDEVKSLNAIFRDIFK